mmetsp:Transcript_20007/g.29812  ORF Transcript_20007/g.29812 Transcript_20007/m.29812 type:complete len:89 (-) Transcript_20007:133-399(-)
MEKEKNRYTGCKGLPTKEFYRRLPKNEKIWFLSMFRRPIRGEGKSKGNLEALLELEAGEISCNHWKDALKYQEKFIAEKVPRTENSLT